MLHQSIVNGREPALFGVHSCRDSLFPVSDLSGPSLVQLPLYWPVTRPIGMAMVFAPGWLQTHLAGAMIWDTGATFRLARLQGTSKNALHGIFLHGKAKTRF